MTDWLELDRQYLMPTYHRLPIAIAQAKGNYLYDTEGKPYLDLFTGLAVNILGHSHPTVLKALHGQGDQFLPHLQQISQSACHPVGGTPYRPQHRGQGLFCQLRGGSDGSGGKAGSQMVRETRRWKKRICGDEKELPRAHAGSSTTHPAAGCLSGFSATGFPGT